MNSTWCSVLEVLEAHLLKMGLDLFVTLWLFVDKVQLGTVGEWVGAIMAGAAVIWAVVIASRERRDRESAEEHERSAQARAERAERREVAALEREREAQEAAARERKEAQARRVVSWLTTREAEKEDFTRYSIQALMNQIQVLAVLNGSDAPVFQVAVFNRPDDGNLDPLHTMNVLPPGPPVILDLPPGHLERGDIVTQFRDVAGQWWLRGHDGHLEETTSNELWDS